jgi:hypothetical protein
MATISGLRFGLYADVNYRMANCSAMLDIES